jgi:hypothetical protein
VHTVWRRDDVQCATEGPAWEELCLLGRGYKRRVDGCWAKSVDVVAVPIGKSEGAKRFM